MGLFARVAELGSGAYGARHARVRPSVMQCVLAVRETVVIKPSRLNIVAQGLSNSLPRSVSQPLYTPPSLRWALTRLQVSGLAESNTRRERERGRVASTLHTHRHASLTVSRCIRLLPSLRLCIGPAREAGLSTGT